MVCSCGACMTVLAKAMHQRTNCSQQRARVVPAHRAEEKAEGLAPEGLACGQQEAERLTASSAAMLAWLEVLLPGAGAALAGLAQALVRGATCCPASCSARRRLTSRRSCRLTRCAG